MNQELLVALEERWDAMAQTIRTLRAENQSLKEQLKDREDQIDRMRDDAEQAQSRLDGLQSEKSRVIEKVESLLARFDDMAP